MTVETATFVADLQPSYPPATDPRSQGDDHIRLIKQVLQNTFGGANRQIQFPSATSFSISSSLVKANGESIIYVSTTSGAVTMTLPTLTSVDAGWKCWFIKTSGDANPIFIKPPTGTINSGGVAGLAQARRCIPGIQCMAVWDGAAWFVTRALALPVGSCIEFHGSSLPAGYEWPSGQVLSSAANYPEYNYLMGGLTTLDKRGRVAIALDNLGGASAGRLGGGMITGTAVGNSGGVDIVTLTNLQIPSHQHNVYVKVNETPHSHNLSNSVIVYTGASAGGGGTLAGNTTLNSTQTASTGISATVGSVAGVANDNLTTSVGGNQSHSNLQPSIMVSEVLVVE